MKKLFITLLTSIALTAMSQPIEVVVPYSTGGPVDILGRAITRYLNDTESEAITVNRPGADGRIGMKYAVQKGAEAPTVVAAATGPALFNQVLYANPGYATADFDWIVPILRAPVAIMVSNNSGINNLQDFINRGRTGKLNCGVSNSSGQFAGRYFVDHLKFADTQLVPYKGTNDLLLAVVSNNIECGIDVVTTFKPQHSDNRLKIIAMGSVAADADFARIPLFSSVIPGYSHYNWYGAAVPKSVAPAKRELLVRRLKQMHLDPTFRTTIGHLSFELIAPPADSDRFIQTEFRKFDGLRERLGIAKLND